MKSGKPAFLLAKFCCSKNYGEDSFSNPLDAKYLPPVETSTRPGIYSIEKYKWLAEGDGQTEQDHLAFISEQLEWVAVNDCDEPIGFINAEDHHTSLHICEVSVCQPWQGRGWVKAD